MRVLLTRRFPGRTVEMAETRFDAAVGDGPMDAAACRAALGAYDAILSTIGDDWSAAAFEGGPHRCRLLANFGVGWNHVDGEAAAAAGVMVSNTPDATTEPTADIALTLILMTARRAGAAERMVRAGAWAGFGETPMGMALAGKTLGIIGLGRIGKAVRRRGQAIGMEVIHFNRSETGVPGQVRDLREMMARSDVACCCVPGSASTRHIVDATALAAMPPHAILVNVSRGDCVDEAALIDALERGAIGGAGLDVYEDEPRVPRALMREDTVLLPHIGTASVEVREAMGLMALDNIAALAEGRAPPNRVA